MIDKIMSSPHRAMITLLTAVLLAVIHQYLFYDLDIGVSYPIFVILFYSFMYIFARDRMRALTIVDAWIASVILLLSLTYLLFDNVLFQVLNFLVIPSLVLLHLAYAMGRKKRQWWELRLIGTAIDHVLPQTIRHWGTIGSMMIGAGGRKMEKTQKVIVFKVLIGLLASIPFLLVVLTLLSSADGVFNAYLSGFPEWLDQLALMPMLSRIIWIIVAAIMFFGYVWGFVQPMQYEAERSENAHWKSSPDLSAVQPYRGAEQSTSNSENEREIIHAFTPLTPLKQTLHKQEDPFKLDSIITATILTVMNGVYILFVLVQFSYLFGAGKGYLPEDLSYAEYARNGFTELVLVTGLNFLILVVVLQYTQIKGRMGLIVQQVLLLILVCCSAIMLGSAFVRLNLYEQAYGYTYIRYLVQAFMIFLGLLLIIAALRIRYTKIPLIRCYIVLGLSAYTLMNYMGMDNRIAELNIKRYYQTGNIDTTYLASLSADALPLLKEFASKEFPELETLLMERKQVLDMHVKDASWVSFNFARHNAWVDLSK